MAAELVGTAYVRIRAITAGLGKEISEGVEKGVKDAGPDVAKAGEGLGSDVSEGASKSFGKDFPDGVADGVAKGLDSPDVHKAGAKGGEGVAGDVTKGFGDETKRRNPFSSLLDAFKRTGKDIGGTDLSGDIGGAFDTPGLHKAVEDAGGGYSDDVERGFTAQSKRRNPFRSISSAFKSVFSDVRRGDGIDLNLDSPEVLKDAEKGGTKVAGALRKGVEKENDRHNPFASFGKKMQESFALPKPISWLGFFGPATFAPIVGSILSGIGLIVEALGFIVTAAAGAGIALVGVAAVAAPGLGVLFAALKVETKQLADFKDEAKKLLKPWEQVGIATQKTLLPPLENVLKNIQHLIPLFVEFGGRIGKIVGNFAEMASKTLTSEKNMRALGKILDASEGFFQNITDAAGSFIDALLPFLAAAAPLAVQLSDSIKNWAAHLAEVINLKSGTGELAATFQTWYDRFVLLAGIIGNVFIGLWNILQIASTSATPFFDKIAEGAKAFADWTSSAEGKNQIKDFFDHIQPVLDEVWRLLGNLVNLIIKPAVSGGGDAGLATMFDRLATALDFLNDILENPLTAKVVPYLLDLAVAFTVLSFTGGAIAGISTKIIQFGDAMAGLGKVLGGIGNVVLKPFELLGQAIFGFSKVIVTALADISIALLTTPAGIVLLTLAAAAAAVYIAFRNWDTIVAFLKQAWEWFSKLSLPLKIVVGAFAALVLNTNPIGLFVVAVLGITAAIKNWDAIVEVVNNLYDAIFRFVTDLPRLFQETVLPAVERFVQRLPEILAGIPDIIVNALTTLIRNLPGWLLDAAGALWNVGENMLGLLAAGFQAAAPKAIQFFIELPSRILELIGKALPTILSVAAKVIGFLVEGFTKYGPRVLIFFTLLPFKLINALRDGLIQAFPRVLQWFKDLPKNAGSAILTALKYIIVTGAKIIGAILKGLINNIPRVFTFFKNLPGQILTFLGDLAPVLLQAGINLMNGLWDGINQVWDEIDHFFGELPGKIGGFFKRLPGIVIGVLTDFVNMVIGFFTGLWDTLVGHSIIPDMIMDIVGWFAKLPLLLLETLAGLVADLIGFFTGLAVDLVAALPAAFQALWDFFTLLPAKLVEFFVLGVQTLIDLGGKIVGWIVQGLTTLAQTLWDFFTGLPGKLVGFVTAAASNLIDLGGQFITWLLQGVAAIEIQLWNWFTALPGKIWDTVWAVGQRVVELGGQFITWALQGIAGIEIQLWNWFTALPGKIFGFVTAAAQKVIDIGSSIINWIIDGLKSIAETLWAFFTGLPQTIWDKVSGVSQTIINLGKQIIQWMINGIWQAEKDIWGFFTDLPQTIWDKVSAVSSKLIDLGKKIVGWIADGIRAAPGVIIDAIKAAAGPVGSLLSHLPGIGGIFGEMGGIIPATRYGTPIIAGEKNRAEALVPITRPSRALAVMQQAGLDRLVLDAFSAPSSAAGAKGVSAKEVTMLHIDTAVMNQPVDADLVVQKVTSAYNRLAS